MFQKVENNGITTIKMLMTLVFLSHTLFTTAQANNQKGQNFWQTVSNRQLPEAGHRHIVPQKFRAYQLNEQAIRKALAAAPHESLADRTQGTTLSFPMPNGQLVDFKVFESPILHPELAKKYPDIKTFSARSTDGKNTMRLDITPQGFHAFAFTEAGAVFIDPYSNAPTGYYMSYYKKDYINEAKMKSHVCKVTDEHRPNTLSPHEQSTRRENTVLQTYRIAVAATGEYTTFHGGTKALALAAITTSINRVNTLYIKDLAIKLEIIAGNDQIIYINPLTDPYTEGNSNSVIGENQANLDATIGSAAYDIGHCFGRPSSSGDGLAYLEGVCNSNSKARAYTGSTAPMGDAFDIDFVAHEIGHQFGATHTFSYCGGSGSGAAAVEPGSGTTIMAYAGLCGSSDVAINSSPYFHAVSLAEINAYARGAVGGGCAVRATFPFNKPTASTQAIAGLTIPISTPFELTGAGQDADGDQLTYCWEQMDSDMGMPLGQVQDNGPAFRSFDPVASPTRVFPRLQTILQNQHLTPSSTRSELLASYSRSYSFRLTVRDNNNQAGGTAFANLFFSATSEAGPFNVSIPSGSGITWSKNTPQTVMWNIANTNNAPVNCTAVDILLSTDGGNTFPHVLADDTPNDGIHNVTLPNVETTTARIKIKGSNNIFFDISDFNFSIDNSTSTHELTDGNVLKIYPNPVVQNNNLFLEFTKPLNAGYSLDLYDSVGKLIYNENKKYHSSEQITIGMNNLPIGFYFLRLKTSKGDALTSKIIVTK